MFTWFAFNIFAITMHPKNNNQLHQILTFIQPWQPWVFYVLYQSWYFWFVLPSYTSLLKPILLAWLYCFHCTILIWKEAQSHLKKYVSVFITTLFHWFPYKTTLQCLQNMYPWQLYIWKYMNMSIYENGTLQAIEFSLSKCLPST